MFNAYCGNQGIIHKLTLPYLLESIDVVERGWGYPTSIMERGGGDFIRVRENFTPLASFWD